MDLGWVGEAHKRLDIPRRADAVQHKLLCGIGAVFVEGIEYGSHGGGIAGGLLIDTIENLSSIRSS